MMEERESVWLPYQNDADWGQLKNFFDVFSSVHSLQSLHEVIATHSGEGSSLRARFQRLRGLGLYLERHCNEEERDQFFGATLSFIVHTASCLRDRVPESGILQLGSQENACTRIGRPLAVSLLANAFLCTYPEPQIEQEGEQEVEHHPFSFSGLYHHLQMDTENAAAVAVQLKFVVTYFYFLGKNNAFMSGTITIRRQSMPLTDAPSLTTWQTCKLPLCTVSVDSSAPFEDLNVHYLQVDCADCVSGEGNFLKSGTKYFMYPELLISCLVLDPLRDNEAAVINGVERYADYRESDGRLVCVGERTKFPDVDQGFTSVVAIYAVQSPDQQFTDQCLLRDLNRTFTGFLCVREEGDKRAEPSTSSDVTQDSAEEDHSTHPSPPLAAELTDVAVSGPVAGQVTAAKDSDSVSELPVVAVESEEEAVSVSVQTSSLVSSIIRCGVKMASGGGGDNREAEREKETRVADFASEISGSILSSVLSMKCPATSTTPTNSDEIVADGAKSDPHSSNHTEEVSAQPSTATTADILARNIISDVLSRDGTSPSSPPPISPRTVGQPTNPAVEWKVHSYADKMADTILSGMFSDPLAPQEVTRRAGENGQSSQSSSLTGQGITLHEFTDDLVECVVREGLLIARLQARGAERAVGLAEGGGDVMEVERGEEGEEGGGEVMSVSERDANNVAEFLVARSIQSVLEDAQRKREESPSERFEGKGGLRPFSGASRRSESPLRSSGKPGLLRQALERPKLLTSVPPERDSVASDLEHGASSSLLFLSAPSSRMSYAWSVASTRDEGSRPVSPTDLDRMALSFVGSVEEYGSMFAELVIRGAIVEVTGNKKYMCHVPVKSHHNSRESLTSGDLRVAVPPFTSGGMVGGGLSGYTPSRLDTFLSTLDEAEPMEGEEEVGEGEQEFSWGRFTVQKDLLRKVATSNWGCGELGGDPQLKSVLQWAAVSASGRSEMVYFPCHDQRMEELAKVTESLQSKQWTVGQLVSAVLRYAHLDTLGRGQTLFEFLLNQ